MIRVFCVTVKHDKGTSRLRIIARDKKTAIATVMEIEGCPKSAIANVSEVRLTKSQKYLHI